MFLQLFFITRVRAFLRKNFVRLGIFVIGVVFYGTISEYFLERGATNSGVHSFFDSLWFVMQTITTVGYGDTPVVTFWGRVNAIALMVVGIGVLGFFSASFASVLIEYSTSRRLGERRIRMKNHIVICNWNSITSDLVSQIVTERQRPSIILLAPLEHSPSDKVDFVKGTCLHLEDLQKANVSEADSVIFLADTITDGELASAVDAKTILGIMNARKISKDAHLVAELLKMDSVENAKSAGANEMVVRGQVSAKLLSRAALFPGTSDIIESILTAKSGEEIFESPLPQWALGKTWIDLSKTYLEKNATALALRSSAGVLRVNPPSATAVEQGSSVVYISSSRI